MATKIVFFLDWRSAPIGNVRRGEEGGLPSEVGGGAALEKGCLTDAGLLDF